MRKSSLTNAIGWSFADQLILQIIRIAISAVLARLILPSEFGLLAMASSTLGIFVLFKNFGLGAAIIQKKEVSKNHLDSLFWFNIFLSVIVSIIILLSSPYIAEFYDEPKVKQIFYALALLFIIGSFSTIPDSLIRKQLRFKEFFIRNLAVLIFGGIVAIIAAYFGLGVWALVIRNYINLIFAIYINFKMVQWRPSLHFKWNEILPYMKFSFPLFLDNVLNYFVRNSDNILVGKQLGKTTLGYYNRAYGLMTMPLNKITFSVSRVLFPAFSRDQTNKEKIWSNYLKIIHLTAYVSFPLMLSLFLLADEIIIGLYGKNWAPSVPMFKGLALIGAIQTIGSYMGTVFQSIGKTKLIFLLGLFLKPIMIFAIFCGVYCGNIMTMIYAYSLASFFVFLIESYFLAKSFNQELFDIFKSFVPIILLLIFSFAPALFIIYFMKHTILTKVLTVTLSYTLFIFLSYKFKFEAWRFISSKLSPILKEIHGKIKRK